MWRKTWSRSTNSRLPFVVNVTLNLSVIAFFSPFPVVHMRRSCLASSLPQSSTKVSRVVHCYLQDAHPADVVPPSPTPAWSLLFRRGQKWSSRTSTLFLFGGSGGGGGEGGRRNMSFILRIHMASSIFSNIFVQDCRLSYGTNCFDYHFHYKNLP